MILIFSSIYRYLDTSLIDVDVQPNHVRIIVKQRIFQLALNDEVRLDAATSKRSQTTGHLLVTMPKLSIDKTNQNVLDENNIGSNELSEYERNDYMQIITSIIIFNTTNNIHSNCEVSC